MEYKIVYSSKWMSYDVAAKELEENVQSLIKEGWEPKGGIAITRDKYDRFLLSQAMVKMR